MKARDIIPGWPRGKSTSGPPRVGITLLQVWLYANGWNEGMSSEAHDVMSDVHYHEGHQAMVDRWRQHGKITPPLFFHKIEPLTNPEKVENWQRLLRQEKWTAFSSH
jgi:hypothetical protein